jgi:hypothetical protein
MAGVDPKPSPSIKLAELRKKGDEKGVISEWLAGHQEAAASLDTRVAMLAKIPRSEWDKNHFRKIKGKDARGLWELKWKAEAKEFRAVGYDHREGYFVMLTGCTHKQSVYDPPGWKQIAIKNKAAYEAKNGNWEIVEY